MLGIMSILAIHEELQLGRVIRSARHQRGWTQHELAARANVSRAVLQKLEEGRGGTVNLATAFRLLQAMSLDLAIANRPGNPIRLEPDVYV